MAGTDQWASNDPGAVQYGEAGATALAVSDLTKVYGRGPRRVSALRGVTASFLAGTFTAVMGPSGSGKSTFMHCAAGLDRPSSGTVTIGDTEIGKLSEAKLTKLRRERVGFVFQSFNLLPALSVNQNVTLPLRLAGLHADKREVQRVLARLGLDGAGRRRPTQLSGGQQQRVAIARALLARPAILVADEPTGALDSTTGREVLDALREAVDRTGQTVLMVTHDAFAASYADRVLFLSDGHLAGEIAGAPADQIAAVVARLER